MVTELGTVRLVVADNPTTAPAEGAVWLSVTVHSVDPPGFNTAGTQVSVESWGVADTIDRVVLILRPLYEAYTVTV